MSTQQDTMNSSSLAITSSVLLPHNANESTVLKRRRVKLQTLPGAWIEDNSMEEDDQDKENMQQQFVKIVSATPPRLPNQIITTSAAASDEDIEFLKQTIASLRKEKEKLEETNDIVKKSIQIVARKRMIAQTNSHLKKAQKQQTSDAASAITDEEEEEDIYIVVPSDFMPTQEEMKAAGLDGWEWISAY
ncbi:hypothetical protein FB192DRAFT_1401572 [Mucor lusitanicus]|uniref:Uncharacterized protein n=2 Tax=Mucor circinelloides f. lusitanicus TaxID=29924 RepID=A0A168HV58_MUCCL|nr:hypothetical protein FB192DRAFT_1401572 [Mucor lusitanicus]OAC99223.1 hypothetical protein MUCCIDRAFT_84169 [Mucor lusitanicus CBS 277.49]